MDQNKEECMIQNLNTQIIYLFHIVSQGTNDTKYTNSYQKQNLVFFFFLII